MKLNQQIKRMCSSSIEEELFGYNAYDILGIPETSTSADIKASFRKLAKETHPDLSPSPSASRRFLLVVAAYEILSDSVKRAQYDSYLLSHRKTPEKQPGLERQMHAYNLSVNMTKQINAVEWLELYRLAIHDILSHKKVARNHGFGIIESEFYSAIRAAYYGPLIESWDYLPDSFEAEERSDPQTSEVLHLVSGRDMFGMVNLVNHVPRFPNKHYDDLAFLNIGNSGINKTSKYACPNKKSVFSMNIDIPTMPVDKASDYAYDDLELEISGEVVATASRISPNRLSNNKAVCDLQDHIHVFLNLSEHSNGDSLSSSAKLPIPLGTIKGLGTSSEEGSCFVYDRENEKTHMIIKHRSFMVKHLYWYQVGDEVSSCECRCSRAHLPPSKFWLFAPRCNLHDVGGWYIETFGHDKNGKNVLSRRKWDDAVESHERRLHPAMYLMALAYRTLDIELAKRRKGTVRSFIEAKISSILSWCKKLK